MLALTMALAVAATPVTVEVFTESYCPCSGTFHEQYYNNIMPLIDSIAVLNRSWDGAAHGDKVKCFHGERECEANTLQACAQNMAGANYKQWLNYTVCINGPCKNVGCPEQYSVAENSSLAREQSCAAAVGLDWNTMYSCYTGPLGKQLLMRDALFDSAEKEGYGLRGLPVVKVNGKLFSKFWDCDSYKADYHKALVQEVCAAYTGADKPAACSQ